MAAPTFNVMLHHLSPDAKSVGTNYAHEQLQGVSPAQLRALLVGLSDAAGRFTIYEPATPEIRIKTDRSAFVVRTRHRRLCLVGWEGKLRGEEHDVGFILSTVTGAAEPGKLEADAAGRGSASPIPAGTTDSTPPFSTGSSAPFVPGKAKADEGRIPKRAKITGLALLIVAFNAVTVRLVFFQEARTPMPKTATIPEFETGALLAKAAGEYETGGAEGDRRLIIEPGGNLRLAKYGPERAVLQETTRTAKGGMVNNRQVLVTSDPAVVDVKDANTVVYFGTTFKRRVR